MVYVRILGVPQSLPDRTWIPGQAVFVFKFKRISEACETSPKVLVMWDYVVDVCDECLEDKSLHMSECKR